MGVPIKKLKGTWLSVILYRKFQMIPSGTDIMIAAIRLAKIR
ncbi:hypothetical protein IMSAGC004_00549 [Bacteroidaceae bacterium]|nr:hypothetical protein IMSAGC004_00549 [Bacteroidaceae bacterium]